MTAGRGVVQAETNSTIKGRWRMNYWAKLAPEEAPAAAPSQMDVRQVIPTLLVNAIRKTFHPDTIRQRNPRPNNENNAGGQRTTQPLHEMDISDLWKQSHSPKSDITNYNRQKRQQLCHGSRTNTVAIILSTKGIYLSW